MKSHEIRKSFLDFFYDREHYILEGASLIPSDPTVLFTLAGMLPLKPFFTGERKPVSTRLTSCQRCFRTNDIDNVGKTNFHHTLFEMLGNFSIGDYFKESAIPWAYEYLTGVVGLPTDHLLISVHPDDEESLSEWKKVGISPEKIINDRSNFWMMGDVGPCGPDSEIYFDWNAGEDYPQKDGYVDLDDPRFVELWNIVFTQFNAKKDGSKEPLPRKNIDTGAGLERITAVSQGICSSFESDLFQGIMIAINSFTKVEDTQRKRMIADHVKAVVFLIGDGVFPANDGRGYVLKRLLRRVLLAGKQLDIKGVFVSQLAESVIGKYKLAYPLLDERRDAIKKIIGNEEKQFISTLDMGIDLLTNKMKSLERGDTLDGETAFKLYDTYGFPLELTVEYAGERGIDVNTNEFKARLSAQKERGRKSYTGQKSFEKTNSYISFRDDTGESDFVGYKNKTLADAKVLGIIKDESSVSSASEGDTVLFSTDKTPFYPEQGGQIGDSGIAYSDKVKLKILDTSTPAHNLILHKAEIVAGHLNVGDSIDMEIVDVKRNDITHAHTATHLIHSALKNELGDYANQAGSWVGENELRFDFTTTEGALSDYQIARIESQVNKTVWECIPVATRNMGIKQAKEEGAVALFGEKYGESVRVITIGSTSKELCGGCHVDNTGEIGMVKITSESSIGGGIRRITALTGIKALAYTQEKEHALKNIADTLGTSVSDANSKVEDLLSQLSSAKKQIKSMTEGAAKSKVSGLTDKVVSIGGVNVVVERVDGFGTKEMLRLCDEVLEELGSGIVVLIGKSKKGMNLSVVSKDVPPERIHSGKLVGSVGKVVGFKGGGRPDMGQSGGIDPSKANQTQDEFRKQIKALLEG